jgi:protein phosphatase
MSEEQEKTAPFDTEALRAGWASRSEERPQYHTWVSVGAKTDLGRVRENNEDKFEYLEPEEPSVLARKGRVFAVADGMGGHSSGQIAAEIALNGFIRYYYADISADVAEALRRAVQNANNQVIEVARTVPGRAGMGATLTAAVLRERELYIAQVGDSRCYLLRNQQLRQITEDHSWVAEQVRAGVMTEAEAEQSPYRNVITRSMGGAPDVEPDVCAVEVQVGDRFLLCSDGLSGMVTAPELGSVLAAGSASVAAWELVDRANQYGGRDNITSMVIDIVEVREWPAERVAEEGANEGEAGGMETAKLASLDTAELNGAETGADTTEVAPRVGDRGAADPAAGHGKNRDVPAVPASPSLDTRPTRRRGFVKSLFGRA